MTKCFFLSPKPGPKKDSGDKQHSWQFPPTGQRISNQQQKASENLKKEVASCPSSKESRPPSHQQGVDLRARHSPHMPNETICLDLHGQDLGEDLWTLFCTCGLYPATHRINWAHVLPWNAAAPSAKHYRASGPPHQEVPDDSIPHSRWLCRTYTNCALCSWLRRLSRTRALTEPSWHATSLEFH